MKTRFSSLVVAAFLMTSACAIAAGEKLSAELKDAHAVNGGDQAVEVLFLLKNESSAPISLPERWNSWGARQWWFTVKDANNKEFTLDNPQMDWAKNFLTLFTIKPNETFTLRCRLTNSFSEFGGAPTKDGVSIFDESLSHSDSAKFEKWVFPLKVTGHFAPKQNDAGQTHSREGAIDTPTIEPVRKEVIFESRS